MPRLDESGLIQRLHVERQCARRNAEAIRDLACGQAFRARGDEQPEHREAAVLREGSEGQYGALNLHLSRLMEMM